MARFVSIQTNFSTGEMDPLLRARVDLEAYQNALSEATNVVIQPQGGLRRRPGTRFLYGLPNSGSESAGNGVRCVAFEFSTSDSYMLVFTHNRMYVFRNKTLITNINGSGNPYLDTTAVGLTGARLSSICWTQSADTLIVVHEDIVPVRIVRGATNADWTATSITFDSVPKYNFVSRVFPPQGTMTPSAISGKITLTASTAALAGTAQAGSTSTSIRLASTASAVNDFYNGQFVRTTGGTGSGQVRQIIDYDGTTKQATVDTAWTVTPDATTAYSIVIFDTTASVGQYINASPQGRARIIAVTSATVASAIVEFPFFSATAIASGSWEIETKYEPVWSSTRGYPRTVTFHEGRLYFGGSKSRPSTIWASRVGLFFDFEATEGLDDDAIEATLDTNTYNAITDIISGRDLQVFTTGGEFYVPQAGLEPVTPTNFFVKTISRHGSKEGIRVQQLESGTIFVQRQGKALNELAFNDVQLTYITNKISLLAGHLLMGPVKIALRRTVATDENDLLLIVNGTSGTMAAFSLLRGQNVIAPSEFVTDGSFVDVGVDITTIYSVVKRTIDGVDQWFVEYFDDDVYTDCAVVGGAAASISAAHLVGETVNVKLDGTVQANQVVPVGGSVVFSRSSTTSCEVGLPYSVVVKTMPVELRLQTGTRIGFRKRIVEVHALLNESQYLKINNIEVPIRSFDTASIIDNDVPEFTGTKVLHGILGYSQDAQITVSQDLPLKLRLLGLEYKVAVHQGT